MHTRANIAVGSDGRSATLTLNGKQLLARIVSQSAGARFVDAAAVPSPSSPHPEQQNSNDGVRKLSIAVSTKGNTTLAVQFTPLSSVAPVPSPPGITALDSWRLETEGASRASGVRVNGTNIPNFSPTVLYYSTRWDPASTIPTVAAYKSGATVRSTAPSSIPGVATTTITEPGKTPTTYRVLIDRGPMQIKSATATRTTAGDPSLTFDGDPSTYWSTWQDNSITYTLTEPRSIKSIVIDWRANSSRHTKFEVETSWNGATWTTRYDGAYDGSSGQQLIVPTSSASSKYVRITGHGDQGSDPRTSIGEVTLYNYNSAPPTSSPDPARLGSVTLSGVPVSMSKGQTAALAFKAFRANGQQLSESSIQAVRYVSGDSSIVSIGSDGAVTAKAAGSTSIGVIVERGGITESAYVTVTVEDPLKIRIFANADAYVRGGASAGKNYGKDAQLAVKPANAGSTDQSYTRIAYVGFDLSQIKGREVASATLSINGAVTEPSGDRVRLDAHAVEQAWSENAITFDNRPALGATVGSAAVDKTFAYRSGDVTDYVSAKAKSSANSLSLGFTQDTPFLGGAPFIAQIKSRESSTPAYIDVVLKPQRLAIADSSSTYTAEGSPASTYDGDPSTYWSTRDANSILYALEKPEAVKSAIVSWRANTSERTNFELQTSETGASWTTKYTGVFEGPSGDQTIVMSDAPAVQQVRIVGRGDGSTDPDTSISEVSFFNSDITEIAPDRVPLHLGAVALSGLPSDLPLGGKATGSVAATSTTGSPIEASSFTAAFRSSDPDILSVDESGIVTPRSVGTADVEVIVESNGASLGTSVSVTVTDPTRVRVYANADAYVRGGSSAEKNFGGDSRLSVKPASPGMKDESYTRIAYVTFDLSALEGKTIISATLSLNTAVTEAAGDSARIDAYSVDGVWDERDVTFANRPSLGAPVASMTVDRTFQYNTADISAHVGSTLGASSSTLSLGFTEDTPFLTGKPLIVQIRSRESSVPPYIDIVLEE